MTRPFLGHSRAAVTLTSSGEAIIIPLLTIEQISSINGGLCFINRVVLFLS